MKRIIFGHVSILAACSTTAWALLGCSGAQGAAGSNDQEQVASSKQAVSLLNDFLTPRHSGGLPVSWDSDKAAHLAQTMGWGCKGSLSSGKAWSVDSSGSCSQVDSSTLADEANQLGAAVASYNEDLSANVLPNNWTEDVADPKGVFDNLLIKQEHNYRDIGDPKQSDFQPSLKALWDPNVFNGSDAWQGDGITRTWGDDHFNVNVETTNWYYRSNGMGYAGSHAVTAMVFGTQVPLVSLTVQNECDGIWLGAHCHYFTSMQALGSTLSVTASGGSKTPKKKKKGSHGSFIGQALTPQAGGDYTADASIPGGLVPTDVYSIFFGFLTGTNLNTSNDFDFSLGPIAFNTTVSVRVDPEMHFQFNQNYGLGVGDSRPIEEAMGQGTFTFNVQTPATVSVSGGPTFQIIDAGITSNFDLLTLDAERNFTTTLLNNPSHTMPQALVAVVGDDTTHYNGMLHGRILAHLQVGQPGSNSSVSGWKGEFNFINAKGVNGGGPGEWNAVHLTPSLLKNFQVIEYQWKTCGMGVQPPVAPCPIKGNTP